MSESNDRIVGRLEGKLDGIEATLKTALEGIEKKLKEGEERFVKIEKRIYTISGVIVIILSVLGYGLPEIAQMLLGGTPPPPTEATTPALPATPAPPALPPAP